MENEVKTSIKWKEKCRAYEELENEEEKWTKQRMTGKKKTTARNSCCGEWKERKQNSTLKNITYTNEAFTTGEWRTSRKQSVRDKSKYNNNKHYQ